MPRNKYNGNSSISSSRIERLLRERELRKNSKASYSNEASDGNRSSELSELELRSREGDDPGVSYVEQYLEGALAAHALTDGLDRPDGGSFRQRLLVVANRLPVSAVRRGEETWSLEISAGGLVSALLGVKEVEAKWIGWAGVNVPDEAGQNALTKALAEKRCIPVFLDEEIVHQYYNGYCNNILWPLFHYLGLPQEDRLATTRSFQSQFAAYEKANQMFADVVNKHYEEGDVVWCHDYHLMFLPKCLKEYNSKMKVGWFLHTPFPSSEIHRTLPSRSELLRAVLAADLVGFHTYDYARHFVSACTRILGLEGTPEGVEDQGRLTRVAAFPIGIDSDRFIRVLEVPQVQEHIKELKERFSGRKIMTNSKVKPIFKSLSASVLGNESVLNDIGFLHSPDTIDDLKPVTHFLAVDVSSKKGIRLLHEGIRYLMAGSRNARLGVFFNAILDAESPDLLFVIVFEITASSYSHKKKVLNFLDQLISFYEHYYMLHVKMKMKLM